MTCRAPAKINLSLQITGRRQDGFHELVSIMQTVGLWDELEIRPAPSFQFRCSQPTLTHGNLVERAARLLADETHASRASDIYLKKSIPVGAGLGGGSSDAAAALVGLSRCWNIPVGCERLRTLATNLGSDVPYFLYGGTALVEGRGEHVTPLPPMETVWWLLVNPGFTVSTADVFNELTPREWSSGEQTRQMAHQLNAAASPGPNNLQPALFRLYPAAERCYRAVAAVAPGATFVTGSGPTVCAGFRTRGEAENAAAELQPHSYWTAIAPTYRPEEGATPCA